MPQPTAFSSASDGIEEGAAVGAGCVCVSENDAGGGSFSLGFGVGVGDDVSANVNDGVHDGVSVGVCAAARLVATTIHTAIQKRSTMCRFMCSCSAEGAIGSLGALIFSQGPAQPCTASWR